MATELIYDPYDEELRANPQPVWRRLRDEVPLYWNEQYRFYALSRFDDVLAASLDWQTYSSARGTVLELIDDSPPESYHPAEQPGLGMMIFMDPPRHDALRQLVNRAFTPRRVAALEERARQLCAQFLGPWTTGDTFDFLEHCAAKIPSMLIGALLGVPEADQDQLRHWVDAGIRYQEGGPSPEQLEALTSLDGYIRTLIADRTRSPLDDMVSDLVTAEIVDEDGNASRRLSPDEVMSFFLLLEAAGSETTARLLGWAAVLLARHPDQRARLVAEPELIPNAVEELLRYEAPSPIQARFVQRDVQWYGKTVPAYSKLALITGSAGRDERRYPQPDVFDVGRQFDRHTSFGYGVHFCLGASLARLEARVVLDELLHRFPEWTINEDGVEMVRTSTVRGPSRVPLQV